MHSEDIPLFFQIKYILNIHTDWALCGKLLIPLSFCYHYYAYLVKYEKDWTVLDPFEVVDHQALDTYSVDDKLLVSMWHLC
uniref:Uncharacterized protein n=1 Tax=Anguilla anguilla TaxID=7936 RepID=A0A0E9UEJ9_ANGAN